MQRALRLLDDAAFAPSLAARLHLALAERAALTGTSGLVRRHLRRARRLYRLASSPSENLERTWRDARIAAAAERHAEAEPLFDRVRLELLAAGSLEEAASITLDHTVSLIAASRLDSIPNPSHLVPAPLVCLVSTARKTLEGVEWATESNSL